MSRYGFLFILCCFAIIPFAVYAQETNVGFVQGLWYSTAHIFADKSVRMYVAVRNYTGSDLTGTVSFLDGTKTIGTQKVQALDGRIVETWADWSPTYGTHTVSANLSRIELSTIGSTTKTITTTSGLAQDTFFVDYDTDGDGIGNSTDTDDDSDGIPDTQETINGTDLLTPNPPPAPKKTVLIDTNTPGDSQSTGGTVSAGTDTSTTSPQGIEQYLAQGPAEEALSSVTQVISQTKQNLDAYRTSRDQKLYEETHPQNFTVDAKGFGPITRTITPDLNKAQLPKFQGSSTIEKSLNAGKWLVNLVYSFILSGASFTLGHPIFVQLFVLILILFILIKLASKFGGRRRKI